MVVAHHQGDDALDFLRRLGLARFAGVRIFARSLKAENPEMPPARREVGIRDLLYLQSWHTLIIRFSKAGSGRNGHGVK